MRSATMLWVGLVLALPASLSAQGQSLEDLEKQLEQLKREEVQKDRAAAQKARQQAQQRAKEAAEQEERKALEAQRASDPTQIRLESGLLLSDWLLLAEGRLGKGEHAALLQEGLPLLRQHAAVQPLKVLMDRVVAAQVKGLSVHSASSARTARPHLNQLAQAFPENPEVQNLLGQSSHLLGEFDVAAAHYRRALEALSPHDPSRQALLELFQKASANEELKLDIGPVKERPWPQEMEKHRADIEQALACVGEATAGIDYNYSFAGTFKQNNSATSYHVRNQSHGRGLTRAIMDSNTDADRRVEVDAGIAVLPFSFWSESRSRMVSGSIAGTVFELRMRTYETQCEGRFFPVGPHKRFVIRDKFETWNQTSGSSCCNSSLHTVAQREFQMEIGQPLDATQIATEAAWLRISGPGSERWRVYQARQSSKSNYIQLDMPEDNKQHYTSTATDDVGVFVEGPNVFIGEKQFGQYYQPGWTVTLEAVP